MNAITQDRWYQTEAVQSLYDYFAKHNGNPLLAMPTGSGKSRVIARFLTSVYQQWPYQRVLILTHIKEIIKQNASQIKHIWNDAPIGIYSAGLGIKQATYPITYGGVKSVLNVIEAFRHIDLLIIDEAHLLGVASDGMYMKLITALRTVNPQLKIIGLSATCWRTGLGLLTNGEIFDDICYNLCTVQGFKRLFAEGYLVPPRTKPMQTMLDMRGAKINAGEFTKQALYDATCDKDVTWAALQESLNNNTDRAVRLVFNTGIDHAILSAEMLRALGCKAYAVHSRMSTMERDEIITAYRAGEFDTLCNNGIATTGLDHPPIDHIIGLRPTASCGLNVQMIGRGMRPYEMNGWRKLDCMYSDHAGNIARLGPIDDPYIPKLKVKADGDMPVKICPQCGTYNHTRAVACDFCGYEFQFAINYTVKAHEAIVVKSDLPLYETYNVDEVYYMQYMKRNATLDSRPTLKAVYKSGIQTFKEYIPFEGRYRPKVIKWWQQRSSTDYVPETVTEAIRLVDKLIPPKTIHVWVNKKYPEIIDYSF